MTRGIFMELPRSLAQALDVHRDAVLAFCQDLVRIASENPPGNHYRDCTDRLHLELDRLGLDHRVVEAPAYHDRRRYNVLGFHGTGQRTLYFHGHYDVVPAQSREQFTPVVRNGRLYGRGSTDMKSGLAAMMYATYLLKELKVWDRSRKEGSPALLMVQRRQSTRRSSFSRGFSVVRCFRRAAFIESAGEPKREPVSIAKAEPFATGG
jgi:arginine utilization protein RocB